MKKGVMWFTAFIFFVIASCAVITVNIYFPEKDVKEAYKNLEKELMTPGEKGQDQKQEETPSQKPESSIHFDFIGTAYAQESALADKISAIVRKMPDVVNAYRQIGAKLPDINRLRDSGAVGEGKDGMLVVRDNSLAPADREIVDTVNTSRRIVINGMAKAIIRINRVPENAENMKQVLPQATEQFASYRRDAAKKGWWVQDASGNWSRK